MFFMSGDGWGVSDRTKTAGGDRAAVRRPVASAISVRGEPVPPDDLRGAREPHSVFGMGRDLGSREIFRPVLSRRTQWLQ